MQRGEKRPTVGAVLPRVLKIAVCCGLATACSRGHDSGEKRPPARVSAASSVEFAAPRPSSSSQPSDPDSVSHASPAVAAGEPVRSTERRQVDGARLRADHVARLKTDRSKVVVLSGQSALELGERACQAAVPERPRDAPVLVKPNLCGFDGFKNPEKTGGDDGVTGRVTSSEFTRGVVRCLKSRGYRRITLADGCGNSYQHWQKAVEIAGFSAMAAEEGVPLVALDDDGVFDKQAGKPGLPLAIRGIEHSHVPTLLMPQLLADVLEHGLFISVPKIKAHRFAVVSIGIKGMQGTVMRSEAAPAYNQKWRMHEELKAYLHDRHQHLPEDRAKYVASLEAFAERMLDVLEISLPDVVLAEGTPAMSGDGFQNVRQVPGMIAIAGTNPVLVDRVGAEYLGLWNNAELGRQLGGHKSSPLIELGARRYGIDLTNPALEGDGVDALRAPRPIFFKAIAPFALPASAQRAPLPSAAPSSSPAVDVVQSADRSLPAAPDLAIPASPERTEVPLVHARRTTVDPIIDGKLDELWSGAPVARFRSDYRGDDSGIATAVRFLWRPGALFVLFELEGADLHVDATRPVSVERAKLYEEDCVELFLAPDAARPEHYYEIELGPLGQFLDLELDRSAHLSRTDWSSGLQVRTSSDRAAHRALIEARFDAKELTAPLVSGARLPLALYRTEGTDPRHYLAWRPPRTSKPNFHVASGFGTLAIDP